MYRKLRPGKPADKPDTNYVVLDIENYAGDHPRSGEVICIDTCWRDENGIQHKLVKTWREWLSWAISKAHKDKKFSTFWAHNGGGWDWLSLIDAIINDGLLSNDVNARNCRCNIAGSGLVTFSIDLPDYGVTLKFNDSYKLLRSSLDKLSQKVLGKGKIETDGKLPHEILEENEPLFYDYVKQDTELLLELMEETGKLLYEITGLPKWKSTIASTAMGGFRTRYLQRDILIPINNELCGYLEEGYRGGRVECFKPGIYPSVKVYDINSLYPYSMVAGKVPTTGKTTRTTKLGTLEQTGLYYVRFSQTRTDKLPLLMVGGTGEYSGEGWYYLPELRYFVDNKLGSLEILDGYLFTESDYIFNDYVNTLYNLRLTDPDGPISLLAKYLLNSLYGKFGQKKEQESLMVFNSFAEKVEAIDNPNIAVREIDRSKNIYSITEEIESNFAHVGIAGTITSNARVTLYKYLDSVPKKYVIYCDTDSVHILNGDIPVGTNLGEMKLEFQGQGAYAGRKTYALKDSVAEKIRAKGITVGGRNGYRLDYNRMVGIVKGMNITAEYQTPPTIRQVLSGTKSCKFYPKHRTIRKTA